MKITIIGAGEVGSHVALFCALKEYGDIFLMDKDYIKAEGHASDINQSLSALYKDSDVKGGYDHSLLYDADIVVLSVGKRRWDDIKRIDLMDINKDDVKECANQIRVFAPDCTVIVVTNPVDEMTDIVRKQTGFPRDRILCFGNSLDTARFRETIHRQTGKRRSMIKCNVMGYHDENAGHLYADISDIDTNESRYMAITTIRKKGATVFAPAICVTEAVGRCLRVNEYS